MFVDSHCHLHFIDYAKLQSSLDTVVSNALQNEVMHMLCVGTDFSQLSEIQEIQNKYPGNISIACGLHPNEEYKNKTNISKQLTTDEILKSIEGKNVVALGETGLDYHWKICSHKEQQARFIAHINAAKACKKPLIVHVRDARDDALKILKSENAGEVGGVIHCFTDDCDTAKKYLDLGFYISFSGIVTFPKATQIHDVVKNIPLDKVLTETDAPYLAPIPYRGKINQPEYVRYVAEYIAKLRDISVEEVAKVTTANYFNLFGK